MSYPQSYQSYGALDPWKQQVIKGSVILILLGLLYNQCYQMALAIQFTLAHPYTPWTLWQWSWDVSNGFFVALTLFGLYCFFRSYLHYQKSHWPLIQLRPEPSVHVREEPIDSLGTTPTVSHGATSDARSVRKSATPPRVLPTYRTLLFLPQKAWSLLLHIVRIRITFAVKFTVTAISITGHCIVQLYDRYAAILAFIARRAQEHAIEEKEMRKQIFYNGYEKDTLFKDKSKIREQVNEAAKQLDEHPQWIELFRHKPQKPQYAALQLSDECEIEEPTFLNTSYERVQMVRDHPEEMTLYPLELLRSDTLEHLKRKDGLFLVECLESHFSIWQWAVPDFQHYREKWAVVLLYSAYRECKAGMQTEDQHRKEDHFQHAMKCCKAVLDATSRVVPDSSHGKDALNLFLRLCLSLRTSREARTVYPRFVKRMQRLEPKWTPGEIIEQLYQDAITPEPTAH